MYDNLYFKLKINYWIYYVVMLVLDGIESVYVVGIYININICGGKNY